MKSLTAGQCLLPGGSRSSQSGVTGGPKPNSSWPSWERSSDLETCGGFPTCATKTAGVSGFTLATAISCGKKNPRGWDAFLFAGVFFIPYTLFMFTCGIPLFFLETSMGQYTNQGGITCWRKICPLFQGFMMLLIEYFKYKHFPGRVHHILNGTPCVITHVFYIQKWLLTPPPHVLLGIGYASHLIIAFSGTSYIIIIAWAFFYLFSSFSADLPWATCGNYWNTGMLSCCMWKSGIRITQFNIELTLDFSFINKNTCLCIVRHKPLTTQWLNANLCKWKHVIDSVFIQ